MTSYWTLDGLNYADNFRGIVQKNQLSWSDRLFYDIRDPETGQWHATDQWHLNKYGPIDTLKYQFEFRKSPKKLKIADVVLISTANLTLMTRALVESEFMDLLGGNAVFYPFRISDVDYLGFRTSKVIECVDEERSEFLTTTFLSGRVFRYRAPLLQLKNIPPDAPPYFAPGAAEDIRSIPIFSDAFVDRCRSLNLVHSPFRQVYPVAERLRF